MSPEAHRAALEHARLSGDWAFAERVTRARAWLHLLATIKASAHRVWTALRAAGAARRA